MYYGITQQTKSTLSPESRRKLGLLYSNILNSNYGSATQAVIAENSRKLEEEQRAQDLAARKAQYGLDKDALKLQEDIAEQQAKQGKIGSYMNMATLGTQVADYIPEGTIDKAYSGLTNLFKSPSVAPTGGELSTGVGGDIAANELAMTGLGTGDAAVSALGSSGMSSFSGAGADVAATELAASQAGTLGGSASAAGAEAGAAPWWSSAGTSLYTLGATIGQTMLANDTDTMYEGQPTGSIFSTNKSGNWRPRFGNDPWKGWINDKLGFKPTAGEKWDAAVYNNDWKTALQRTPAAISQWLDPIGDLGSDVITGLTDKLGGPSWVSDTINAVTNPINFVSDKISDSYICGATDKIIGMDKGDLKLLNIMYIHAIKTRPDLGKYYMKHGKELVRIMNNEVKDLEKHYSFIKENMLEPTLKKLRDGDIDGGLDIYIMCCTELFKEFSKELYEGLPK